MNIFALTYLYTIHKIAIQISFPDKKKSTKNAKHTKTQTNTNFFDKIY